jgi:hypothetical protein
LQISVDRSMSLTEDGLSLTSPKPFNSFNWTHWSLLLLLFEQFVLAHCCGFLYKSHVWNLQQKIILHKMLCLHDPQNQFDCFDGFKFFLLNHSPCICQCSWTEMGG